MPRKMIIGGNWKMQIASVEETIKTAKEIAEQLVFTSVEVFIAPTYTALFSLGKEIKNTSLKLAAQNMYYQEKGAFTGKISVNSLLDAQCEYVILGHSEPRRIFGETNEEINKKVLKALEKGLKVVLCVGETAKEREDDKIAEINENQLAGSLKDVTSDQMENIVIAYEPVWAINNPHLNPDTEIKPATPEQAEHAHQIIRNWITEQYDLTTAMNTTIQYGGSMKPHNAKELLSQENIDGGLVGSASLSAKDFIPIIKTAEEIATSGKPN